MSRFFGLILGFLICSSVCNAAVTSITLVGNYAGGYAGTFDDGVNPETGFNTTTKLGTSQGTLGSPLSGYFLNESIGLSGPAVATWVRNQSSGTAPGSGTSPDVTVQSTTTFDSTLNKLTIDAKALLLVAGSSAGMQGLQYLKLTLNLNSAMTLDQTGTMAYNDYSYFKINTVTFDKWSTTASLNSGLNTIEIFNVAKFGVNPESGNYSDGMSGHFLLTETGGGSGVVPEPASCAIFGALGLGALIARRRRVSK